MAEVWISIVLASRLYSNAQALLLFALHVSRLRRGRRVSE